MVVAVPATEHRPLVELMDAQVANFLTAAVRGAEFCAVGQWRNHTSLLFMMLLVMVIFLEGFFSFVELGVGGDDRFLGGLGVDLVHGECIFVALLVLIVVVVVVLLMLTFGS